MKDENRNVISAFFSRRTSFVEFVLTALLLAFGINLISGRKIDIFFKLSMFLSREGLNYYRWLDAFLARLEKGISEQYFFDAIQWKSAYPLIEHINSVVSELEIRPNSDIEEDLS